MKPSILTNMAFWQSPVWSRAATSICRENESPDELGAFRQAIRLLKKRAAFDVVVTMGARPSLAYGLCCAFLRVPSKQIMVEYFLDIPKPASPVWRAKMTLYRWIARRAIGILTNSSGEVEATRQRFRLPPGRVRFVPMYTTIASPRLEEENAGYVYSVGRTLRDNQTLLEAASTFHAPLVLVVGKDEPLPQNLSSRIEVRREIPLEETHQLLQRCALVVIPLLPTQRSTGQVVLFEAMALGKPVVATGLVGITDYVRNGKNGRIVPPQNAPALAQAVNHLLDHPAEARRMALQALDDIQARWMPDQHAVHMLGAIRNLSETGHQNGETATLSDCPP